MIMPRVALEDIKLRSRLSSMSPEEFTALYRQHLPQVSKYLARRVNPSDLEELASKIFEIAWQKRAQAPSGFELPWLYRIAGYVVANHRRSESARGSFLAALRPSESSPSAEDIAINDISLSRAWAKLSPAERQVISLSSFEGLDNPSAAKVLQISTNAFALRLSKAKSKLKGLLS